MKICVVFVVGMLAYASATRLSDLTANELFAKMKKGEVTPENYSIILGNQAEKAVKNFLKQMRCGWPEAGIPPLAPYTNADMKITVERAIVDSVLEFIKFRLDGLDDMQIKKLDVDYVFGHDVKFKFYYPEIKATAQSFSSNTFFDMLNQLGLSIRYEGEGPMKFAVRGLRLNGEFKYKAPYVFGSLKIYNFKLTIGLDSVVSNIGGILGNGEVNNMVNQELEYWIPKIVNENQALISKYVEEILVPRVNEKLKGNKIWSIIFSGSSAKCSPTPAPFIVDV